MSSFSEFSKKVKEPDNRKDVTKRGIDPKTYKQKEERNTVKDLNKVNSNPRTSSPSDRS